MALQQLRSSTANKRPTAAAMSDGQLAVNTNATNPGLFFKDADGSVRKVGPVFIGSSAPNSSPATGGSTGHAVGEQWLDNTGGTYVLKIWDGTAWRSESGTFVDVSGDTMTGDLVMNNANLVFEGATADDFETTLTVTDPTADRTIALPNVSGTVVTTGDTGTVTSTMIVNGTIVNADVNASAAIAGTKISPNFGSQNVITTGKIEVGTVIDLNANGSAQFAGTISLSDDGIRSTGIFPNGSISLRGSSSTGNSYFLLGEDESANQKFIINTDGSATFAGDGHFKCGNSAHADTGVQFINDGEVKIYRPTGGGSSVNLISGSAGVGSPSEQFAIKANGNATFGTTSSGASGAGGMEFTTTNGQLDLVNTNSGSFITGYNRNSTSQVFNIGANGSATFKAPSGSGVEVQTVGGNEGTKFPFVGKNTSGTTTFSVNGDGSATFAGSVQAGGNAQSGTAVGTRLNSYGAVHAARTNNSDVVWGGYKVGNSTPTSQLTADGSASFRSTVTSGSSDRRGQFNAQCPSSVVASSAGCFVAQYNGSTVINMRYDGSSEFAADVTTNQNLLVKGSDANGLYIRNGANTAWNVQLKGNGQAEFAGNVILGTGGTGMSQIFASGSQAILHVSGGGSGAGNVNFYSGSHATLPKTITFQTNSIERVRIASTGYTQFGGYLIGTGNHRINGINNSQGDVILSVSGYQVSGGTNQDTALFYAVNAGGSVSAQAAGLRMYKNTGTNRSISTAGTINASGADYAEYMTKAGDFTIAKGDVCGINIEGKLTNVFADAISFVVKSTDPSYVGGDTWHTTVGEEPGGYEDTRTEEEIAAAKVIYEEAVEAARQLVDRISFSGQVPVNVTGATPGQYIIPTAAADGSIEGTAKSEADLTMAEYMSSVGKVIAIENDGRAKIIVKVA